MLLKYYQNTVPSVAPISCTPTKSGWFGRWTAMGNQQPKIHTPVLDPKHEFNLQVTQTQAKYPVGKFVWVPTYGRCEVMEYLEMRGLCNKNIQHNQYEFIKVKTFSNFPELRKEITICPKQITGEWHDTPTLSTS